MAAQAERTCGGIEVKDALFGTKFGGKRNEDRLFGVCSFFDGDTTTRTFYDTLGFLDRTRKNLSERC